jgi:hypothetical protein
MRTVIETADFVRDALKIWSEEEYDAFIEWISIHPDAGDLIVGTGGARKVRWSASGGGKSGGTRIIYFNRDAAGTVFLLAIYAKSTQESMAAKSIKRRAKNG